eukprot:4661873-Amphidinium_carterae.1
MRLLGGGPWAETQTETHDRQQFRKSDCEAQRSSKDTPSSYTVTHRDGYCGSKRGYTEEKLKS